MRGRGSANGGHPSEPLLPLWRSQRAHWHQGFLESRPPEVFLPLSMSVRLSWDPARLCPCGRALAMPAHVSVWARVRLCVCRWVCVCKVECASTSALTQRMSWAQGLGGHAAVHGEVERLLHFGPDDSVRKTRKPSRERRRKQDSRSPRSCAFLRAP